MERQKVFGYLKHFLGQWIEGRGTAQPLGQLIKKYYIPFNALSTQEHQAQTPNSISMQQLPFKISYT